MARTTRRLWVAAAALAGLQVGTVIAAQKLAVTALRDPKADFTAIKTYAWLPPLKMVANVAPGAVTNPTLSQEVRLCGWHA